LFVYNIAKASLTIDGISYVADNRLEKYPINMLIETKPIIKKQQNMIET